MTWPLRRAAVALVLTAALGLQPTPAHAAYGSPEELPEPTGKQLAASVQVWDPARSVRTWSLDGAVTAVEQVETKAGETTISLSTDILFTPDSAKLPSSAAAKVVLLVNKVPENATVKINGHTDSVKGAVDNKVLSTDRANAVSAVLRKERPDLDLKVKGMAATEPAVREDPNDPSSFAANRRVEIIYGN